MRKEERVVTEGNLAPLLNNRIIASFRLEKTL